jgi:hypothetical protein
LPQLIVAVNLLRAVKHLGELFLRKVFILAHISDSFIYHNNSIFDCRCTNYNKPQNAVLTYTANCGIISYACLFK